MKFKNFLLKDGQVIEEELEVHYEMENSSELYIGDIKRIETKLSEKICEDSRILEMFSRKEEADEKYKSSVRRLFNGTWTSNRPRDSLFEMRKNKPQTIRLDGRT